MIGYMYTLLEAMSMDSFLLDPLMKVFHQIWEVLGHDFFRNQQFCCQREQTCGLCLYQFNVVSEVENGMVKSSALLA